VKPSVLKLWIMSRIRSVLVKVTSAIFVPFQHADAVTTMGLRYRCSIDTVGCENGEIDLKANPELTAKYLQEIRSGIRSMRRLHDAAVARWRRPV
jgi:hypothetical protein